MAHFLASRQGSVTAAVAERRTGAVWVYGPWGRAITASIIKVDILRDVAR